MGSQHPSPNVENLCNFEMQIQLEIITSRDAKSACFKGSQTSCPEISSGVFLGQSLARKDHIVRPEKWDDSQVRFRDSNASGGHIVLLPGAFWAEDASKMATLGASLLV